MHVWKKLKGVHIKEIGADKCQFTIGDRRRFAVERGYWRVGIADHPVVTDKADPFMAHPAYIVDAELHAAFQVVTDGDVRDAVSFQS